MCHKPIMLFGRRVQKTAIKVIITWTVHYSNTFGLFRCIWIKLMPENGNTSKTISGSCTILNESWSYLKESHAYLQYAICCMWQCKIFCNYKNKSKLPFRHCSVLQQYTVYINVHIYKTAAHIKSHLQKGVSTQVHDTKQRRHKISNYSW